MSLAAVLTADGNQFDSNWYDYDIVTEAVLAVLAAKPDSAVGVLADGTTPVTAFIPNDRAFGRLARDLTGTWPSTEKAIFNALAEAVGIDAIESVLLYHVVPGATIDSGMALKADGAKLNTDGVVEGHAPGGEQFGVERLVDLLARNVADNLSAAESMRRVGRALVAHHAAHLADDASILLVHWPGPGDGQ